MQHVRTFSPPQRNEAYRHPNARGNDASNSTKFAQVECNRCKQFGHQPERCFILTLQLTCNKCGMIGHKATVCKSRPPSTSSQAQHKSSDNSRSSSQNWRAKTPNNNRTQSRSQSPGRFFSHYVDETKSQDVSDASTHVN